MSKEIKYIWEDCVVLIKCPYCNEELILDSQNGPTTCKCGKVFILYAHANEICTEAEISEL